MKKTEIHIHHHHHHHHHHGNRNNENNEPHRMKPPSYSESVRLYYLAGMKSGQIADHQLSSSGSFGNRTHNTHTKARLDSAAGAGAWSPSDHDPNTYKYLQVDLLKAENICGVITQGRATGSDHFVTAFKVQVGPNVNNLRYLADCRGQPQLFHGNTDRYSHKYTMFERVQQARIIRIVPTYWNTHPDLRCEILLEETKINQKLCLAGLKSGYIRDSQLSSSGSFDNKIINTAQHARLDSVKGAGAWSPADHNPSTYKWIQVDFRQPRQVFGVVTQGRATGSNHYVTAFKVQYGNSPNMQQMRYISDRTGQPMLFHGNTDRYQWKTNLFPNPVHARFVRIVPTLWHTHPDLRFDLVTSVAEEIKCRQLKY